MKRPKSKTVIETTEQPSHEEMTISPHPKYAHYTKFEWECDYTGDFSDPLENYTLHQITLGEINTCETSRLMHDLRADPNNPLVKAGPGQLILAVESAPVHPSDVFVKPEFRQFVKKAYQQDVCWIYFVKPGSNILIKLCVAGSSGGKIKEITKNSIELSCLFMDLYVFFINQFRRFYSLCNMSGISLGAANAHLKALIEPLFPMIQVVPLSSKKVTEPQWLIDAYRRVNPRYVPGKSVVRTGEMIREIFFAESFRSESK